MESRLVERTFDFVVLNEPIGKAREFVGADVVDGEEFVAEPTQRNLLLADCHQSRDVVFDIFGFGGEVPIVTRNRIQNGLPYDDGTRASISRWMNSLRSPATYLSPDLYIL